MMKKTIKLSEFAKTHGVVYKTAFLWFQAGKIPGAFKSESGSIFVTLAGEASVSDKNERVCIYARVSNQGRRKEMQLQVDRILSYSASKGLIVDSVFHEVASGMNDNRRELWKMLDSNPTKILIENKDRLTRFGFSYLEKLLQKQGCEIVVINPDNNDEQDLIKDLVSVITSFCCRLYGLRRTKNKLAKIKALVEEK